MERYPNVFTVVSKIVILTYICLIVHRLMFSIVEIKTSLPVHGYMTKQYRTLSSPSYSGALTLI